MSGFCQGDIIRISGFKRQLFVIVSKNAFIKATGIFHVCPMLSNIQAGPIHIPVCGKKGESGTVICEQIKAIDPGARGSPPSYVYTLYRISFVYAITCCSSNPL